MPCTRLLTIIIALFNIVYWINKHALDILKFTGCKYRLKKYTELDNCKAIELHREPKKVECEKRELFSKVNKYAGISFLSTFCLQYVGVNKYNSLSSEQIHIIGRAFAPGKEVNHSSKRVKWHLNLNAFV